MSKQSEEQGHLVPPSHTVQDEGLESGKHHGDQDGYLSVLQAGGVPCIGVDLSNSSHIRLGPAYGSRSWSTTVLTVFPILVMS